MPQYGSVLALEEDGSYCGSCDNYVSLFFDITVTGRRGEEIWRCQECFRDEHDVYPEDSPWVSSHFGEFFGLENNTDGYNYSLEPPPFTLVPELPNRPSRRISCEQEITMGGNWVACKLHEAGLSYRDRILNYSSQPHHNYLCAVKQDSSVEEEGGAEIVYSKMRLDDPLTAAKFQRGLNIVRHGIYTEEPQQVNINMFAGWHTHVDLMPGSPELNYTIGNVESLYHLWCYLEDVIYRVASARWIHGHRLDRKNTHASRVPKGLLQNRKATQFLNTLRDSGRNSLNLTPFVESLYSCNCGAVQIGLWDDCTCELNKPTAEFRVFNGTANLKKILVFTSLPLAMVTAAKNYTFTEEEFPTLSYTGLVNRKLELPDHDLLWERMKFMCRKLPLTDLERECLIWCFRNSSLKQLEDMGERFSGLLPGGRRSRRHSQLTQLATA